MTNKILSMTHADYLAHAAYGSSDIIKMGRSFAYWKWRKENKDAPGRALVVGSAAHLLIRKELTGENHTGESVQVYPDGTWRTKGFEKFSAENRGVYCLDQEEFGLVNRMAAAVLKDPEAMSYLKGAIAEPTIMRPFPGTSVNAKCRPDYLHMDRRVSINLKTCADASESGFFYSTRDFQYDWQSAFYCDMLTEEFGRSFDEVHILVEKTEEGEPPVVRCYTFSDDTLGWARVQIRHILDGIPECEKTGIWPNRQAVLQTVDLPHYMRKIVTE